MDHLAILEPFHPDECFTIGEATTASGEASQTIRNWCRSHQLGRKIGSQWKVSRVALRMYLNGDHAALAAYLSGDRISTAVVSYYGREGISDVLRSPVFEAARLHQLKGGLKKVPAVNGPALAETQENARPV